MKNIYCLFAIIIGCLKAIFDVKRTNVSAIILAYSATELLEARAFLQDAQNGKIQQNELRRPPTGALQAFIDSTPALIMGGNDTLKRIKESSEQVTKVPVLTKLAATNGTARKCGASGPEGDSAMVTLSYGTLVEDFSMSELLYRNNLVKYQEALRHNFMEVFRNLHNRLETLMTGFLETNKSLVNDGSINTFNAGTGTMSVLQANKAQFFASIMAEMGENDFNAPFLNVHTMNQRMIQMLQQLEGSGNSNNLAPQQSGFSHYGSNNFGAAATGQTTSFIFIPGTVGLIGPWLNGLHRDGADIGTDTWTTVPDPFIPGWNWELKIKRACTDNTSISASRSADLVTQFVISGEFSRVKAYTSDTDTGIYKYTLLA